MPWAPSAMTATRPTARRLLEETSRLIDEEARKLVNEAERLAEEVLSASRKALDSVAEALLDRETLTLEEVEEIAGPPPRLRRRHARGELSAEDPVWIALTGKGGAGKSVIAGTLAGLLARRGHRVLALDSDPMPGLTMSLGAEEPTNRR